MKKLLLLISVLVITTGVFAHPTREQILHRNVESAVVKYTVLDLLSAAKRGDMRSVRIRWAQLGKEEAIAQRDKYGNNILHLAKNTEVFHFVWQRLTDDEREALLTQRNKSGETPFMAQIIYGHEPVFLEFFPQSRLYKQLQNTTSSLAQEGLAKQVGEMKREELIKECSLGGVTMWQRAHGLTQAAQADSRYSVYHSAMQQVEDMLAQVAPFLVK